MHPTDRERRKTQRRGRKTQDPFLFRGKREFCVFGRSVFPAVRQRREALHFFLMQLRIFCVQLLFGAIAGLLYEPLRLLDRLRGKLRLLKICLDLLFCLLAGAGYLTLSTAFYGGFRIFHLFGFLSGLFLYEKSFRKIVAFFGGKVYNIARNFIQKQKERPLWQRRENPYPRKKPRGSQ